MVQTIFAFLGENGRNLKYGQPRPRAILRKQKKAKRSAGDEVETRSD